MTVDNNSHYVIKEMFSSKLLSHQTKERLYITYLHVTCTYVTYACKTWASTKRDERKLFERKILRCSHTGINTQFGYWSFREKKK